MKVKATIITALLAAYSAHSLHFYMDTSAEKCFVEELPKGTLVVGKYRIEQYSDKMSNYVENPSLGLQIMVEEVQTHVKQRLKNYKGASSGRFSFTSGESAQHTICFSTNNTGWFNHDLARVHLDLVIGSTGMEEENEGNGNGQIGGGKSGKVKQKLSEMTQRVRDINNQLVDIRREQQYQRIREAEFRNTSEMANSKAVHWTVIQIVVCAVMAVWQMRHLRTFFEKKKLV